MGQCDNDAPLFWQTGVRQIPQRPDRPEEFPADDIRHWYDIEYAGWTAFKEPQPESPGDGPQEKLITAIVAGDHPYSKEFRQGMKHAAERAGMQLKLITSLWDPEDQERDVDRAIASAPDLIVIWIESMKAGSGLIHKIYDAGIPVIAANTQPDEDGLKYALAWTGPDDWSQFRLLARHFAELMNFQGGYAIVCHMEGTSAYYARSWSAIAELGASAPEMKLLAMASTNLDEELTCIQVKKWIALYGDELKGIISADDNLTQLGINRALEECGRQDIVRVASGSTPTGIDLVRSGDVDAITFQLAERDGALPIKVAADWFSGLDVPPVRHLPTRILDSRNISILENRHEFALNADSDELYQDILDRKSGAVHEYFSLLTEAFARSTDVSMEFFRGFSIEIYSNLHHIIRSASLDEISIVGSYEEIYKRLFQQPTMERTLKWLEEVSQAIILRLGIRRNRQSNLIRRVILYVEEHYADSVSLKTLSYQFEITAPYLGKLFSEETGETFTDWLNRLRIVRAVGLMKTTEYTIRDIAEKVGYSNPNYFYKLFKKYEGINPGEFQTQLNEI